MGQIPEGTVTVLFTDLVGSTELNQQLGDDAARLVMRTIERLVAEQIEAHRGVPIKELGDGTMAAFVSARRAVACAQEIQRAVHAIPDGGRPPVRLRIGLHTGEVLEEDGDIHGETVIIAKRIEGLAPEGGIRTSETVYGVLGTARDELVDAGEFELKGITAPWRLYDVPWEQPDAAADAELFVGRSAEAARLRDAAARAAAGHGSIVLVSGEAGIGKSRLVAELVGSLDGMGAFTGQCLDMTPPPPYRPTIDHLQDAARQLTDEALRALMAENATELAVLMPSLRQRYDDIPLPPELAPDQERHYVLHGVAEFLARASSTQPYVLVFEDIHWVDESTLVLMQDLANRIDEMAVLIVATMRAPEPGTPMAAALPTIRRFGTVVELPLGRLSAADVAMLLERRFGSPPPPEVLDVLLTETEGNALFLNELVAHLTDRGRLFTGDGTWVERLDIGETEVPRGVQLLLASRLEQLSDETRAHLSRAAVLGRTFDHDTGRDLVGIDDDAFLDAVEEGMRQGLVEDQVVAGRARYAFSHEVVRQSLLGELSVARRQRLHARAATLLEREPDESGNGHALAIAHHLERAGNAVDDAVTASAHLRAAEAALRAVAFEDAAAHLDMAERRDIDAGLRTELLLTRARALQGMTRTDEALEVLERAIDLSGEDTMLQRRARLQRVDLLLGLYRGAPALDDLAELGGADDDLACLTRLARAHYILSLDDPDHAAPTRDAYERLYEQAMATGDRHSAVRALIATAAFPDYWPEFHGRAIANIDEATALAASIDDDDLRIDVESARFILDVGNSTATADQLLDRLEARRDPVRLNEHCFRLMWFRWNHCDFGRGVEICDRGLELADQMHAEPVMYGSLKALHLIELGCWDRIEDALAQEVTDDDHPFGLAMTQLARTAFLHEIGAWEEAYATGLVAHASLGTVNRARMQTFVSEFIAASAARCGRLDAVPDQLEQSSVAPLRAVPWGRSADVRVQAAAGEWDRVTATAAQVLEGLDRDAFVLRYRRTQLAAAEAHLHVGDAARAAALAREGLASTSGEHHNLAWQFGSVIARASNDDASRRARDDALDLHADLATRLPPGLRTCFETHPSVLALKRSEHH